MITSPLLRELMALVDAGFEVTFARDLSPHNGLVIRAVTDAQARVNEPVISGAAGIPRVQLDESKVPEEHVRLELLKMRRQIAKLKAEGPPAENGASG